MPEGATELQRRIGSRVRQRRTDMGLTLKNLAERSGLSERFLSGVEAGRSNISIVRLSQLAQALDQPLTSLLRPERVSARQAIDGLLAECTEVELERALSILQVMLGRRIPPVVALLGVRGAGKSMIGAPLAEALGVPFIELADQIEDRAGMSLGDVFTLHGEPYYRGLELECFTHLIERNEPCVVALPGGIVGSLEAMELLRGGCTSLWLRATADDYWDRVFDQGDTRPMSGRSAPRADLRALIQRRAPLYAQADITVDTSGVPPDQVLSRVLAALDARRRRPLAPHTDQD